jgi:hypothetical protein
MSELYGYTAKKLESLFMVQLSNELSDSKSDLNQYWFKKKETLSRDEVLERIRTVRVVIACDNQLETYYRIGELESDSIVKDSIPVPINYDLFIDKIINHYNINIVESCTLDAFCGYACEDFLLKHFEDKSKVDLKKEVQCCVTFKEFKKNILKLMQENITYWKRTANGGSSGLDKDGHSSFYTGSVFVDDFDIRVYTYELVCRYKKIEDVKIDISGIEFWKILYYHLLSRCNTLF